MLINTVAHELSSMFCTNLISHIFVIVYPFLMLSWRLGKEMYDVSLSFNKIFTFKNNNKKKTKRKFPPNKKMSYIGLDFIIGSI